MTIIGTVPISKIISLTRHGAGILMVKLSRSPVVECMCQMMVGCINVGYTEIHVTPGLFAEVVVSQIRSAGGVSLVTQYLRTKRGY